MSTSAGPWLADCRLWPSRRQRVSTGLLYALAAVLVLLSPAPWGLRLLCLPQLGLLARRQYRRQDGVRIVALREQGQGWWLEQADGEGCRAILQPELLLWRWLLVLRFIEDGAEGRPRRFSVLVFPDSLSADAFRRLYVRLRLRHRPELAAELDS